MKKINVIGNENNQTMTFVLVDGREFDLALVYKPQQLGWFMSITHKNKTINNIRVCTSGNILYQWRNIFQFGIACIVEANQEPLLQDDFSTGRAALYVLDRDETENYSRVISGQATA